MTENLGKPVRLSVIVPVRNEEQFIEGTLTDLLAQECDGFGIEIIVIDGKSEDKTVDIVRRVAAEHGEVRLFSNPYRWSSAARNIGIRNARGEYILIVDGHCELRDPGILTNVVTTFERTGADCLGRPQPLEVANASRMQRAIAAARTCWLGHDPNSFIYVWMPQFVPARSVAVAYRKSVFDSIGYFDERFDAHEDGEFNHRVDEAGLRCYHAPEIATHYVPPRTLRGLFRQMVRYGRGRVRLHHKHGTGMKLGTIMPSLLVLFFIVGVVVSWLSLTTAIVYLVGLLSYAVVLVTVSVIAVIQRKDPYLLLLMPLVFLVIHVGAGVGMLVECIRPMADAPAPKSTA